MLRRATVGLLGLSALASCGGAQPSALAPSPTVIVMTYLPRPPAAPPPLVIVPRAEASPRPAPEPREPAIAELRSQGKRHALERRAEGIVVLSEERGVLGFLKSPLPGAEIRWAGFVANDAILLATGESLYRAETPDDAIAGKLEAIATLDPAATTMASGGSVFVAAVPAAGGAFYGSSDGGKHMKTLKRPDKGALAALVARSDGMVVAAIEKERFSDPEGEKGVRAQVFVQRGGGAWSKGPIAEALRGALLEQEGDSITLLVPEGPGDKASHRLRGLDAAGKWIEAAYSNTSWLPFAWTSVDFAPQPPVPRPGFPVPRKEGVINYSIVGGVVGKSKPVCRGVDCLSDRKATGGPRRVRAFSDSVCDKEHAITHTHRVTIPEANGEAPREKEFTTRTCDAAGPAQRGATLLVRDGDERRLVRLPIACASGWIDGTERASFVYCSSEHQGRPAMLHVAPSGALTEVASGVAGALSSLGAESASDGTTVLFTDKASWVCRVAGAPACALLPRDGFLGARPVPGGRALVARRGASERELVLAMFGEPGATPIWATVQGNLLEIEVTAGGYVRLWTSPSLTSLSAASSWSARKGAPPVKAFLVRADGQLVADDTADEPWLSGAR